MRSAGDALDAWRATLSDNDLRPLAFQAAQDEADPDLGIATIIAAIAAHGRASEAFTLAEQRRARDLHDRMLRIEGMRTAPGDSALATSAARAPTRSVTAEEVRRALPDSVALVEFVIGLGGEPTTVLLLSQDTTRTFSTDPVDSLAPDIDALAVRLATNRDAKDLSRRLGASLLRDVVAALTPATTTLLIVPDGTLHRVPFDALILADSTWVFERFATAVVPSAAVALTLWRRPLPEGAVALLAFGDPTFPRESAANDGTDILRSAFDATGGLQRLRGSGAEVRRAAAFADESQVLLREAASEAALKSASLHRFRVIHFATHALVDETSSARTALALAAGGGEDGFVGPGDLAALSMPADLVVLSACRTAGGRLVRGEGQLGLTAPLMAAGARALLATQWPIEDKSAGAMTEHFYSGLAGGLTAAEALQTARMHLERAGAPPSQWAAFVLIGDPTVRIPLRSPPTSLWTWAAVVSLLVLAVLLVLSRRGWWRRERAG